MKELISILKYKRVSLNIILILVSIFFSAYSVLAVPLFFVLTSNLFDILGYHFILIRKQNFLPEKEYIRSYRIIQLMFDITLMILLWVGFGMLPALCGGLLKVFGVQDLLYYFFLKKPFPNIWTWLRWTPIGFFKQKLNLLEVFLQAATGTIISFLIILRYLNLI